MNCAALTPEQRVEAENKINALLAKYDHTAGQRVCLHPDRTVTAVTGGYKIECDYCPAWVRVPFGTLWADIEAWYYEDERT